MKNSKETAIETVQNLVEKFTSSVNLSLQEKMDLLDYAETTKNGKKIGLIEKIVGCGFSYDTTTKFATYHFKKEGDNGKKFQCCCNSSIRNFVDKDGKIDESEIRIKELKNETRKMAIKKLSSTFTDKAINDYFDSLIK